MVGRATLDDATNGDQTVIDFPFEVPFPAASKGKLNLKFATGPCAGPLCPIFGPSSALPRCTQFEIIKMSILDPTGAVFAVSGSSSR